MNPEVSVAFSSFPRTRKSRDPRAKTVALDPRFRALVSGIFVWVEDARQTNPISWAKIV